MSLNRYAKRRDSNESMIIDTLRGFGLYVYPIDTPCDLLVGFKGTTHLIEIKSGPKAKLTPAQRTFQAMWRGSPVVVLSTVEEAEEWAREVRG